MSTDEDLVRSLAAESLAVGDPTGWFEHLYAAAERGTAVVPWDRGAPHHLLELWVSCKQPAPAGRSALVVGCGLGRDAEYLSGLGFATVAFDVSETAVAATRRRFPDSAVRYEAADLLDPPARWHEAFDLVVESMTVQALPESLRSQAIGAVAQFVAPGGTLVVIAAARDDHDPDDQGPPWPLTRAEIGDFTVDGLLPVRIEDIRDEADPTVRRWLAEFRRPRAGEPVAR